MGRLVAIASREARRAPMMERDAAVISIDSGLDGDHKGPKFPRRQITVLAVEAWRDACLELTDLAGPVVLSWTARRANLLVEAVALPRAKGGIISVAGVRLEVTGQTVPCQRMEEVHAGLRRALHPEWRGGVTCRVLLGGKVMVGDPVEVLVAPPERRMRLPG